MGVILQAKYEKMQNNIEKFGSDPKSRRIVTDRPARIEVRVKVTVVFKFIYLRIYQIIYNNK